jgi:hypothetical protein
MSSLGRSEPPARHAAALRAHLPAVWAALPGEALRAMGAAVKMVAVTRGFLLLPSGSAPAAILAPGTYVHPMPVTTRAAVAATCSAAGEPVF